MRTQIIMLSGTIKFDKRVSYLATWNNIEHEGCFKILFIPLVQYQVNLILRVVCPSKNIKKHSTSFSNCLETGSQSIIYSTGQSHCGNFTLTITSYLVLLLHAGHIMHCFVLVWQELMWMLKYFKGWTLQNDKIRSWSTLPVAFVVNDKVI